MKIVLAVLAFAGGTCSALGIWFPRFQAHWKGAHVPCGPISCAGAGLFFVSLAVAFLWPRALADRHAVWLILPIVLSWAVLAVGYAIDVRAYARVSGRQPATSRRGLDRAAQPAWLFVAFAVFFLIVILWNMWFRP